MKKTKLIAKDGCLRKVKGFSGDELVIPWTVTQMGESSLSKCKGLKRLTLPGSLDLMSFQQSGCDSLEEINFDGREVKVRYWYDEDEAFVSPFVICKDTLKKIIFRDSEQIGRELFKNFKALEEIELSENLEVVDSEAFYGCSSLKKVIFPGDYLRFIGAETFAYCKSLRNAIFSGGLKFINDGVFLGCESLEKVVLPDHLEGIGDSAFEGCVKLKEITIPKSVDRIGYKSFMDCKSLEFVELPEGITYIPQSAFRGCKSLTEVVIPSTVKEIDDFAFKDCSSLEKINLPEGLKVVSHNAFFGCGALTELIVPDSVEEMVFPVQLKKLEIPSKMASTESKVKSIFEWRSSLKTLTIRGKEKKFTITREDFENMLNAEKDEKNVSARKA